MTTHRLTVYSISERGVLPQGRAKTCCACGAPFTTRSNAGRCRDCRREYDQARKMGESAPPRRFGPRRGGTCSIPGCDKPNSARGWCKMHHNRWLRHGDPEKVRTAIGAPLKFFNTVVLTYEGDDCLEWPFARANGYGLLYYEGENRKVTRLICEKEYGPPPSPSHQAAHSCGNGHLGCVNRKHLRWATPLENSADRILHDTIRASDASDDELAAQFGLPRATIISIRAGKAARHAA